MAVKPDYLRFVLDQLSGLGRVDSRRMFGGAGLYCEGLFFGLISGDVLYLKVNDSNRADYERERMQPFRPRRDSPNASMSYYEVPAGVLEDAEELVVWARRSICAAVAAGKSRKIR